MKNNMSDVFKSAVKKWAFAFLVLFVPALQPAIAADFTARVKSFEKTTYRAARQNWCVSTAPNGFVYFANHKGLLEFDGTTWQLYPLPGETILRAVKVQNDSTIYSSGYMELGFWKPDRFGKLQYHSLAEKAQRYFTKNIEFWNIATTNDYAYFQSFNRILSFHADTFGVVTLPDFNSVMAQVNSKILVSVRNKGIYELDGNSAKPYVTGDFFNEKLVQFLIPFGSSQLLIGTASHGIFKFDGIKIEPWNEEWTSYFVKNELNRGFKSPDGNIVLGTIIDGVTVFDETGKLLAKINSQNGLLNNTILGIESDAWQNLWLALDDGIGFIPSDQNKGFLIRPLADVGAIYSMTENNGNIYLGSNQGLFIQTAGDEKDYFRLVPETQGQVWDCSVINGQLWVGHNSGTFLVEGAKAKKISNQAGGFSIKPDPLNPDLLIQGTYNDLIVYKKTAGEFHFRNRISGFSDLVRFIEIDHHGTIWASHLHRGVFRITTDDLRMNAIQVSQLGEKEFGRNQQINVFKVENRIVFTTGEQIFTYDDLNDSIVPHPLLNEKTGDFKKSHRIVGAGDHHYWFISKERFGLFEINQERVRLIRWFPASLFNTQPVVDGFENVFPVSEKQAWLCLQNGVAFLDASASDSSLSISSFKPLLRQFELFSSTGKTIQISTEESGLQVNNNISNLFFRFSFPYISDMPVYYSYKLEGLSENWSEPTEKSAFTFERLPRGYYTLHVKAIDPWGGESQIHSIRFEMLPPWYASTTAILIYILLFTGVLLLFRRWGIRMTKRKVQEQHEKREQELTRLRNAKLRDEVEHKSRELASSTMSIIKKNEFLMDLKSIIEKQKNELGSRYPDKYYNYLNKKIDENISNQDDWQVFENNFERAHEQFFTKIKSNYPDLTPGDLRLCAYLHMNLSSKEIAPLLGISVRGVENHRYRLRKKMNLEHDENLVNLITGL